MREDILTEPVDFLNERLGALPNGEVLREYQAWWEQRGRAISEAVDRQVTPPLHMFDRFGERVDEILIPPEYREMLHRGYRAGVGGGAAAE